MPFLEELLKTIPRLGQSVSEAAYREYYPKQYMAEQEQAAAMERLEEQLRAREELARESFEREAGLKREMWGERKTWEQAQAEREFIDKFMLAIGTSPEMTESGRALLSGYLREHHPNLLQYFEGKPTVEIPPPPTVPTEPGLREYVDVGEVAKPTPTVPSGIMGPFVGRKPPKELSDFMAVLDKAGLPLDQKTELLGKYMTVYLKGRVADPSQQVAAVEARNGLYVARYKDGHEEIMTGKGGKPVHQIKNGGSPTTGFWRRDEFTGEVQMLTPPFDPKTSSPEQRERWFENAVRGYIPDVDKFNFRGLNWFDVGMGGTTNIEWQGNVLPLDQFVKAVGAHYGFDVLVTKEKRGVWPASYTRYKVTIGKDLFMAPAQPKGIPTGEMTTLPPKETPIDVKTTEDLEKVPMGGQYTFRDKRYTRTEKGGIPVKPKPPEAARRIPTTKKLKVSWNPQTQEVKVSDDGGKTWRKPTAQEIQYIGKQANIESMISAAP